MSSWFDDASDHELHDLMPFLEELAKSENVYRLLQAPSNGNMSNSTDMVAVSEPDVVIASMGDTNAK